MSEVKRICLFTILVLLSVLLGCQEGRNDKFVPQITGQISLPDSLKSYQVVVAAILDPLGNLSSTHPTSDTAKYYIWLLIGDRLVPPHLDSFVIVPDSSSHRSYSMALPGRSSFSDHLEDDVMLICFADKNGDGKVQWNSEPARYPIKHFDNGELCLAFKLDFNLHLEGNSYSLTCGDSAIVLSAREYADFDFTF